MDGLPGILRGVRERGAEEERSEPRGYRSLRPFRVWRRGDRVPGYPERAGVGEVLRASARKPGTGRRRKVRLELGAGREPGGSSRGDRERLRAALGRRGDRTPRRGGDRPRPAKERTTVSPSPPTGSAR